MNAMTEPLRLRKHRQLMREREEKLLRNTQKPATRSRRAMSGRR